MKEIKITFSFDVITKIRDYQDPKEILGSYSYYYGFNNMKIIKIEEKSENYEIKH